jgi:hypothetical protein
MSMRNHRPQFVALTAALMLAGAPAATVAQDATKAQPGKAEPSQIDRTKAEVKNGARQAGNEIKQGAKTAGHEVKEAAKETSAGVKKGWHEFKQSAADFGRSVKNFFSRLWNS